MKFATLLYFCLVLFIAQLSLASPASIDSQEQNSAHPVRKNSPTEIPKPVLSAGEVAVDNTTEHKGGGGHGGGGKGGGSGGKGGGGVVVAGGGGGNSGQNLVSDVRTGALVFAASMVLSGILGN